MPTPASSFTFYHRIAERAEDLEHIFFSPHVINFRENMPRPNAPGHGERLFLHSNIMTGMCLSGAVIRHSHAVRP